jgi:hypothetical protein
MLEKGLYALITTDAGVSALIGTRAYWVLAPKGSALPQVVLARVTTEDTYDTQGATGLRDAVVQVDCYAADFYGSRAISLAVRKLLESYKGTLADGTRVSAVITRKDWDMPYEEGGKGFVYRALLEFSIHHYDV